MTVARAISGLCAALALSASTACSQKPETNPPPAVTNLAAPANIFKQPIQAPPAYSPTSVVATVNGQSIVEGDVERAAQPMLMRLSQQMPPEQIRMRIPQIRRQAIDMIANRILLAEEAIRQKIVPTADEIQKALDEDCSHLPPGMTLEQALQSQGLTIDSVKKTIGERIAIDKVVDGAMLSAKKPTPEDVAKFYETNKVHFVRSNETVNVRHILVKVDPSDDAAAKEAKRKKAEGLREQLLKGADFAELAKKESDDPGSKVNGGLYPETPQGRMVKPFNDAAFSQKPGEIGPLVETQFGYHILLVDKHNMPGPILLADVKDELARMMDDAGRQKVLAEFIRGLREKAKIVVVEEKSAAVPPPAGP